jgi:hypothetical protein
VYRMSSSCLFDESIGGERIVTPPMHKVMSFARRDWGFELELECGHRRLYFIRDDRPPQDAACYDCAYPKPARESPSSGSPNEVGDRVNREAHSKASDDECFARRGTE